MKIVYKMREEIELKKPLAKRDTFYIKTRKPETLVKFQGDISALGWNNYYWQPDRMDGVTYHYLKVDKISHLIDHKYWRKYKAVSNNKYDIDIPIMYKSMIKYLKSLYDQNQVQTQESGMDINGEGGCENRTEGENK